MYFLCEYFSLFMYVCAFMGFYYCLSIEKMQLINNRSHIFKRIQELISYVYMMDYLLRIIISETKDNDEFKTTLPQCSQHAICQVVCCGHVVVGNNLWKNKTTNKTKFKEPLFPLHTHT